MLSDAEEREKQSRVDMVADEITERFGAALYGKKEVSADHYLPLVEPDDLLKFGLIPEFIGRLPVVATLHSLHEDALFNILTEPKNAIVRQYQKLFKMEGIELEFKEDALKTVVRKAIERKTGARALRSIMEETMLDIMYHLPSKRNITKCSITAETIEGKKEPLYTLKERRASA